MRPGDPLRGLVLSVALGTLVAGAPGCDGGSPGGPGPDGATGAYPIVLAHGFTGFRDLGPLSYYHGVAEDLRARGEVVFEAEVAPYQSSAVRGAELGAFVDAVLAETGAAKVVVIAHSQGGLDARTMISALGYGDRVAALVTVSTPHRGTPLADVILGLQPGLTDELVDFVAGFFGRTISEVETDADFRAAMATLAEANAAAFAAAHPDDPRVAYYSVAGRSLGLRADEACAGGLWGNPAATDQIDPALLAAGLFLAASGEGLEPVANDGLVSVASARHGTFLGCVPADHLDEIGQIADSVPDPSSGWDHRAYYRQLVAFLRAAGH